MTLGSLFKKELGNKMETEKQSDESMKGKRNRLSTSRILLIGIALLVLVVAMWYISSHVSIAPFSTEPTVVFDFDNGYPLLAETQNTPFNQTLNGVTAYFSSPSDTTTAPAFSIQSYDTTFIKLSQFSGKYLYDNKPSRDSLEIRFSQQLKSITLTFATVEYKTEPSNITLTAYMNSIDTPLVGSSISCGTFNNALYPQGTLTFDSGGHPFNLVRIQIPYQGTEGATNFFVDNIIVTTTEQK